MSSLDLFRCESVLFRTYWVRVAMDQYTRRIIGFGNQADVVDGLALCRIKQAIRGVTTVARYLSSDRDPLYRFHQWEADLRILGVTEIKTVPYVPLLHPFVERLIGTIPGNTWTTRYSGRPPIWRRNFESSALRYRTHSALEGHTPIKNPEFKRPELKLYRWQAHCRGLYLTPIAA